MPISDTTMGGSKEGFPETVWSTVLHSPRGARAALEQLCLAYWRPVYRYIRLSQRSTVEDAKDLTQEFFCYVLEEDVVPKYEREKGRFRHFLKGVLRNFLSTTRRDQQRQKRGGGKNLFSLDAPDLETERFLADADEANPEEAFDRQWTADLLAASLSDLKKTLDPAAWRVYDAYYQSSESDSPSYETVARALKLTSHQVKHLLDEARAKFESIVRKRVSQSVTTSTDLADEMNDLFAG